MADIDHEALLDAQAALVRALGYDVTPERLTHAGYLTRALEIFCERNEKYKGVWRQYGALANLVRAAQKIDRTMAVWWFEQGKELPPALDPSHLDDAYDTINHLLFFIICAEGGNLTGKQPEHPSDVDPFGNLKNIIFEPSRRRQTVDSDVIKGPWIDLDTP